MSRPDTKGRLDGRIALVTGASRGIGAAVARRFAAEGAHVVLLGRTQGALEAVDDAIRLQGGAATLVTADLLIPETIGQLGAALAERFGRLDVFVGNAAILGQLGPVFATDMRQWDKVMALNLTANYRLIRSLHPLLMQSDSGRAIFVTCGMAVSPTAYNNAYGVSKAALEMLAGEYAAETASSSIRVNLIDPGIVRTSLRAQGYPGEDAKRWPVPDAVAGSFVSLAEAGCVLHGERIEADVEAV